MENGNVVLPISRPTCEIILKAWNVAVLYKYETVTDRGPLHFIHVIQQPVENSIQD